MLPTVVDHGEEVGRDGLVRAHCPPSARCLGLASGIGRWIEPLLDVCERIDGPVATDASRAGNCTPLAKGWSELPVGV